MFPSDKALLLTFIEDHKDRLGDDGCNDWRWPESWPIMGRVDFAIRFNKWMQAVQPNDPYIMTSTKEEYGPPNFLVLAFLRDQFINGVD